MSEDEVTAVILTDGVAFNCPYGCGGKGMVGIGVDDQGNEVQVMTHTLPYCGGFEATSPAEYLEAARKKNVLPEPN